MLNQKDPVDKTAMGTIAVGGVVLLLIAGWFAFFVDDPAAEDGPQTEQVAAIDVDSVDDENVSDPLPQATPDTQDAEPSGTETAGAADTGTMTTSDETAATEAPEESVQTETAAADAEGSDQGATGPATDGESAADSDATGMSSETAEQDGTDQSVAETTQSDMQEETQAGTDGTQMAQADTADAATEPGTQNAESTDTADATEQDTTGEPQGADAGSDSEGAAAEETQAADASAGGDQQWNEEQMALLSGDAEAGSRVWNQCRACHVADQEQNRVGPHLVDIVGREVASVDGFRYSGALSETGTEVWSPDELSAWLENPRQYAPGTTMAYSGLRDEEDRINLITYLHELNP